MTATEADARGTEVDLRRPQAQPSAIPAKIAYARALAESGLLPDSYRGRPANILWAVEYGEMLGLSTMAAITGVHVIKGKPTASAGLISALVRRAGHKLRVRGDARSATCQIIRSDDPKYTFEVTFTLDDAKTAELLDKDNWKHFGPSMLKARAITQCARDACEEALFGLHYTPEELGADVDGDGVVVGRDPFQPVPSAEGDAYAAGYRAAEESFTPAPPRQDKLAERSAGTPPDDQWYVRPAPEPAAADGRPWADIALDLAKARKFKTEAEAWKLWREAAEPGKCTPKQKDEIQNRVADWIKARRREASDMALRLLPESAADWRAAVEGLSGDDIEGCRESLEEIGRLKGAGTMDETLAGRIAAAIIALCPKAALKAADTDG